MAVAWKIRFTLVVGIAVLAFSTSQQEALAASLSITPNSGTLEIGGTFDVSIVLNTEGKSVNAAKISLDFPADSLQLVSPSVGNSIASIWAVPPKYNNKTGEIDMTCGFANGLSTSNGLITKMTFRVNKSGNAIIKFKDDSQVLLDNGKGTNALNQTNDGVYTFVLPQPDGPAVVSRTHPDQTIWYRKSSVVLSWADVVPDLVEKYSYALSDIPDDVVDDIPEGSQKSVSYENLSSGRHYFHIKALNKDNVWGGVTHYALNIDEESPAVFGIEIFPYNRTSRNNPVVQFITSDSLSGIDHYELRIIPLNKVRDGDVKMFIESKSPYLAQDLEVGDYDVIVRAYDKAGNFRDSIQSLAITSAFAQFVSKEGILVRGEVVISWWLFFPTALAIITFLSYLLWRLRHRHKHMEKAVSKEQLPAEIKRKMEELKQLKKRYKQLVMVVLLIASNFFLTCSAKAEGETLEISTPLITTISRNISNNEIFYVGGQTDNSGEKITIYIKNIQTGESFNEEALADDKGRWFYRHDAFLSEGEYILWAQSKVGGQMSPPSPQARMVVNKTAFQIGSSRISYESMFFLAIAFSLLIILVLIGYIILTAKRMRKKGQLFRKEVDEVEGAVHKGFMILHREISKELKLFEEVKSRKKLSEQENSYMEHLTNDLNRIERHIKKEIVDVEKMLG